MDDKVTLEQLNLINELDKEEKTILLKLIETFVSKKRFKDYLQKIPVFIFACIDEITNSGATHKYYH